VTVTKTNVETSVDGEQLRERLLSTVATELSDVGLDVEQVELTELEFSYSSRYSSTLEVEVRPRDD
jgi:hypothetical protein